MRSRSGPGYGRPFSVALLVLASVSSVLGGIAADPSDIKVTDAWIRWLPANLPGAGYMTLTNTGSATYTLVGAGSADYAEVSFHQTRSHDGMNEMTPVDTIVLKAHSTVRFAEGGYHLMLLRPKRSLQHGDRVLVTLRFGNGQTITVPFLVRAGSETGTPATLSH